MKHIRFGGITKPHRASIYLRERRLGSMQPRIRDAAADAHRTGTPAYGVTPARRLTRAIAASVAAGSQLSIAMRYFPSTTKLGTLSMR